jgi:hypothetical protein
LSSFIAEVWPFSLLKRSAVRPTLVPEFQDPTTLVVGEYIYNPDYYATQATAQAIMDRFSAMVMWEKLVMDVDSIAPPKWWIRFPDGLEVNAGNLAKFFALYPEGKYPNVAARYGVNLIGMIRMAREAERRGGG